MGKEFTIRFTFTAHNVTDTLRAQLHFKDDNTISLAGNKPVQIESTSPLAALNVWQKRMFVEAASNTSGNQQSVTITVPISAVGSILHGNLPGSDGVLVDVRYQFTGYDNSGRIEVGDFDIEFPS
ncbi:hypothetical protein [Paraherbaspirillum soli]|uniref:Uncharacterized protein n=1 Tax=Paraherbaspirillum soli TaxID=631222 RepID=A0ABW0MBY9_9BURK